MSRQAPVGKPQPPKKTAVKEKRDSEESKENQKTRSDDSGEEKNGDEDSQKYGSRKKGTVAVPCRAARSREGRRFIFKEMDSVLSVRCYSDTLS